MSNGSRAAYVDSDVTDSKIKSSSDGGDPGEGDSESDTVPTGCDCGMAGRVYRRRIMCVA